MTPNSAEQLFYEALALQEKNEFTGAEALYRKALHLAPDRPSILLNLAVVLVGLQQYAEAASICAELVHSNPNDDEALLTLGTCQSAMGRNSDALASFDRATKLNPQSIDAWNGRGNSLLDMKQWDAALQSYDRALALAPDHTYVLNNRGNALLALHRHCDALESYDRALQAKADYAVAHNNRGTALLSLDQTRLALESFCKASEIQPGYARARWNEGICRLSLGDFVGGWAQYEWGWQDGQRGEKLDTNKPWWDGNPLRGTLLVWSEQGVGDQILFSSMLPSLAQRVDSIVLAVDRRLVPLFERSFPTGKVVPRDEPLQLTPFDAQIALGSIGQYVRRRWEDFPNKNVKHLISNEIFSSALHARFATGKLICGLSWASRNTAAAESKSIQLQDLRTILALDSIQAVNLQYGDTTDERQHLNDAFSLQVTHFEDVDNFNDIDSLAALIDACDVVITISNTTAHLAGALGKPTLLMLPYGAGRHWYWHEGREDSPWYPSITLFRQTVPGRWDDVIARVKSALVGPHSRQ